MLTNPIWIGTIAGVLVSISMLPQLYKLLKAKKAEDVSTYMLIILLSGVALWIYYGILKHEIPIIATNAFSFLLNSAILGCAIKYKK